jgi:hypothetical protein
LAVLLNYFGLQHCPDLDVWIASPKKIDQSLELTYVEPGRGTTNPVAVQCDGYQRANRFSMTLEVKPRVMHLFFTMAVGAEPQQFYQISSSHKNFSGQAYPDGCCPGSVVHQSGYDKRRAHLCMANNFWGRRSYAALTHSDVAAFLAAAASHLNLTLPTVPFSIKNNPSLAGP